MAIIARLKKSNFGGLETGHIVMVGAGEPNGAFRMLRYFSVSVASCVVDPWIRKHGAH